MDDAYNREAEEMKKNQENAESKMGGKFDEKVKEKPKSKDGKAGKSRSLSPGDPFVRNGPSDPPDDPPDPPGQPPGFPESGRIVTFFQCLRPMGSKIVQVGKGKKH